MTFAELFLFVFSVIGLAHIIVDSSLFAPVRAWLQRRLHPDIYKVFECYQCAGTWCGFFVAALVFPWSVWTVLASGFAGSFLSSFAAFLLNYMEACTMTAMSSNPKDNNVG